MSKVTNINSYKTKKCTKNNIHNSNSDFSDRLKRIRQSLDTINNLMFDLKTISKEKNNDKL